uniref:Uncharacterized protein n=1 Tax=Strombidium rassoulzadegani TaxID=1082188 RepID=A0A7S3CLD6_9SPIT
MVNYQVTDYVENNDLVCFGLSSHDVEEWMPKYTKKAEHELNVLKSWIHGRDIEDLFVRPALKSDYNYNSYATRAQVRVALALAVIRELPVKNFYIRCWLVYGYYMFFVSNGLARGLKPARPLVIYQTQSERRTLLNYPDLFWWTQTRVLPRNPPMPSTDIEWRTRQTPVFHQYHKTTYRYRLRKPRFVPWDGSQNQPVMPFLHDSGTDVTNGTFRRNCNSTPALK